MGKAEELYMKHVYTMGEAENKQDASAMTEVVINKVSAHQRSGLANQRPCRDRNNSEISPNQGFSAGHSKTHARAENEENYNYQGVPTTK